MGGGSKGLMTTTCDTGLELLNTDLESLQKRGDDDDILTHFLCYLKSWATQLKPTFHEKICQNTIMNDTKSKMRERGR